MSFNDWCIDGDYGAIENLLSKEGVLKPQAQKSFLYLCYRQQFLEFIENSMSHLYLLPDIRHIVRILMTSRGISKSIQCTTKTIKTTRTLPTNPIRFLQPSIPNFSRQRPWRTRIERMVRRSSREGKVGEDVEGNDEICGYWDPRGRGEERWEREIGGITETSWSLASDEG
jgi:hypothetical protein